jgi:hypothetical protein
MVVIYDLFKLPIVAFATIPCEITAHD